MERGFLAVHVPSAVTEYQGITSFLLPSQCWNHWGGFLFVNRFPVLTEVIISLKIEIFNYEMSQFLVTSFVYVITFFRECFVVLWAGRWLYADYL